VYFVSGRLCSITKDTPLGLSFSLETCDFVIQADLVSFAFFSYSAFSYDIFQLHPVPKTETRPVRPFVIIAGAVCYFPSPPPFHFLMYLQACARDGEQAFLFDISQYAGGQRQIAGHVCSFPTNQRFPADTTPLSSQGKIISIGGFNCHQLPTAFLTTSLLTSPFLFPNPSPRDVSAVI